MIKHETASINVMLLVHAAMAGCAKRAEQEAERLQKNSSLQPFRTAFNEWVTAIIYLFEREDELFPGHSGDHRPDAIFHRDEAKTRIFAVNREERRELYEKLQGVLDVLNVEIGRTSIIRRTRQHLFGAVLSLRIAQQDYIENERVFVLPALMQSLDPQKQLNMIRALLVDNLSNDPHWILDWIRQHLDPEERALMAGFEEILVP